MSKHTATPPPTAEGLEEARSPIAQASGKTYVKPNETYVKANETFLIALSGGADSVALLRMLIDKGHKVEAAHCNFHLRGEESDRDEAFCKALCEKLGVKLHIAHFDTREFAKLRGISIEMAARDLRYRWFTQLAQDTNAAGVCIAHHSDDQVETILLNLLRGTGLKGLLGMRRQNGIFLRPLLNMSRKDILEYLKRIGQDYVTDSTNLEDDVQRNKLRLDVIPMLETVTPAARQNILRMADNLGDIEKVVERSLDEALDKSKAECNLGEAYCMKAIRSYVSPRLLLWNILSPLGFNRAQTEEILLSAQGGKTWTAKKHVAVVSNDKLFIYPSEAWNKPLPMLRIPEEGLYGLGEHKLRVSISIANNSPQPSRDNRIATLDADGVVFPLTVRPANEGDRLSPYGMKGSKLVSDYLKDKKAEPIERHRQLVVTTATNDIIWLVGRTIDNSKKIGKDTKRVITLTIED